MDESLIWGWITRLLSGFYTVQTANGDVVCQLRGRLKKHRAAGDIIALGDRVGIQLQSDGTGSIEEIAPRTHALVRTAPAARGVYRQVLLANPDQAVFVFACANPTPHLRMLDRFLILAERQGIPALVVANKIDLAPPEVLKKFEIYPPLGYPVVFTSAHSGQGVAELRERLIGKLSAFAGPSGVGKTSLLNAVEPGLGLAVKVVSSLTHKGRHTTNIRQLFPLKAGGHVADLPGMRMLSLWDIHPEELDGYFPEMRELVQDCRYNDCTHQNEPGCAVLEGVQQGRVSPERHESYLRLRFGEGE
ncbi:MAG TPA: ribosome small subunit-dependent GTPase A [Bellilinea sp.]